MKFLIQLLVVLTLLLAMLAAGFHPDSGVLWSNPFALVGIGLIGLGLIRNFQAATPRCRAGISEQ